MDLQKIHFVATVDYRLALDTSVHLSVSLLYVLCIANMSDPKW